MRAYIRSIIASTPTIKLIKIWELQFFMEIWVFR